MDYVKENQDISEKALISVIIPVYNGERYVAEAIDSVLAQEYKNIEIIVVNDGSTDNTEDVVRSYANVKHLFQSRKGVSAARNNGVRCSSGEFIAFLDADDLWTKNKLLTQIDIMMKGPSPDMVFGHAEQFFSPELADILKDKIKMITGAMPGYIPGTMLIKRNSFF